jgi:hypothetical protein
LASASATKGLRRWNNGFHFRHTNPNPVPLNSLIDAEILSISIVSDKHLRGTNIKAYNYIK